jgi:bacteriocin-like protein
MISGQKNESMNEPLDFKELSDLELESIAGGNKEERKRRRRRRWNKVMQFFRRVGRALGPLDGQTIDYKRDL